MRRTLPMFVAAVLAILSTAVLPVIHVGAETAPSSGSVLVLPFVAPAGSKDEWIGKAVQQDLLTDLTQGTLSRVLAPAGTPGALDPQAAVQTAHDLGASIVVFGQAQVAGNEIRLTGEVIDVATAKPLGGLKATGPSDQLFHLEDALAGQVFLSLPRTLLTSQTVQGLEQAAANQQKPGTPPASPQTTEPTSSTGVYVNPPTAEPDQAYAPQSYYSYPTYSYNYYQTPSYDSYYPAYTYAYPSWGYWPYWGSGIIIGGGFDFDFHHHHDFDDHFRGGRDHFDGGRGFGSTGRGFGSTGRGFANGGATSGARGGSMFAPSRPGFSNTGFGRPNSMSRGSSGGFRGGGFRGASSGGFRGGSSGGFHGGGGGGAHGGGGHR